MAHCPLERGGNSPREVSHWARPTTRSHSTWPTGGVGRSPGAARTPRASRGACIGSNGSTGCRGWTTGRCGTTSALPAGDRSHGLAEPGHGQPSNGNDPLRPVPLARRAEDLVWHRSLHALPSVRCSNEARMQPVGFNAQRVRQGVCQRGRTTRQGERTPGPRVRIPWPTTWGSATGVTWPPSSTGCFGPRPRPGSVASGSQAGGWHRSGDDRTRPGGGQAPRQRRIEDQWGRVQASKSPSTARSRSS